MTANTSRLASDGVRSAHRTGTTQRDSRTGAFGGAHGITNAFWSPARHADVPSTHWQVPRAWLVDALMLYGDIARAGRDKGRWEARADAFKAVAITDIGSSLASVLHATQLVTLESAVNYAALNCKSKPALATWSDEALIQAAWRQPVVHDLRSETVPGRWTRKQR